MASLSKRRNNEFVFALFFSGVVALTYFFFLYLLIQTAITQQGVCLYSFWQSSSEGPWSPFSMFAFAVALFLLVSSSLFVKAVVRSNWIRNWQTWYYGTAIAVLCFWANALIDFDYAMAYERGEVTFEEYVADGIPFSTWELEEGIIHVCTAI